MEKYCLNEKVGAGASGCVWKATNKHTGEKVAIKKLLNLQKCHSWKKIREVKSLMKMNHPNIIKLKEVIKECETLYFVFELMECDLLHLMRRRNNKTFSEDETRKWCFQVFQGLNHMHQRGYFHRDLKPENLLVSGDVIKISDFGMVREINSTPPYTDYVGTRWYRAPEVMLGCCMYTSKVDMWAMGAIISELMTFRPLFPGTGTVDELYKICCVLGSPTVSSWPNGLLLARAVNYNFPSIRGVSLSQSIPSASEDAISLISWLCSWDPCKRPTAAEALQHPFFRSCFYIPPSLRLRHGVVVTKPRPIGCHRLCMGAGQVKTG